MGRYSGKKCRLLSMIVLTSIFFVAEVAVGHLTNSMALVADAFHMLSDIAALVVAFISVGLSTKAWKKNTFGWARAEILGALVNAVFLVALCFSITVESLKRFFEPEEVSDPLKILFVGAFGLFVNLLGLCLFHQHGAGHGHSHGVSGSNHGHSHNITKKQTSICIKPETKLNEGSHIHYPDVCVHKPTIEDETVVDGKDQSSQMNMRGVFLHVMADAMGSVVVIISAIVIWKTDWEYKHFVDPALSLIIVLLIMGSVWPLLTESAYILLQAVPHHIDIDELKKKIENNVRGVIDVHELHVWQLTGDRIVASAHIRCQNQADYKRILRSVKDLFHYEGIHSTSVQQEFLDDEQFDFDQVTDDRCLVDCYEEQATKSQLSCGEFKCCQPSNQPKVNKKKVQTVVRKASSFNERTPIPTNATQSFGQSPSSQRTNGDPQGRKFRRSVQQASVRSLPQHHRQSPASNKRTQSQSPGSRPRCGRTQSANFSHENETKNSRRFATRNSFSETSSKNFRKETEMDHHQFVTSEELSV